uniref:Uncharacterized protein n=1 Tax=Trichinella nativa TaxID=6335 RepID=A0A0V1J8N0_9BILA
MSVIHIFGDFQFFRHIPGSTVSQVDVYHFP